MAEGFLFVFPKVERRRRGSSSCGLARSDLPRPSETSCSVAVGSLRAEAEKRRRLATPLWYLLDERMSIRARRVRVRGPMV